MKITVYTQEFCAPCRAIKKQLPAVTARLGIDVEYIDITGKWETATQVGFTTTPAVYLDDDGILTEIESRTALALIAEVSEHANNL